MEGKLEKEEEAQERGRTKWGTRKRNRIGTA
jgi:hypothetical protein